MKSLFISYNGAFEPLMQSQGIPYLKGLSCKGVKCFLLTFEKEDPRFCKKEKDKLKSELKRNDIEWYSLEYHKRPSLPATLFDIFIGTVVGLYLVIFKKIDIVHARTTVPAAMGFAISRIARKKFIFDERGLTAEEYVDGGMWKRNSFSYKLTLYFEKKFLIRTDHLIVLSQNIRDFLINSDYLSINYRDRNEDISFVPCCVDLARFDSRKISLTEELRKKHNFSGKFVFLYIGSLGTWYLLDKMMDFFITAKRTIGNAHFLILTHTGKGIAEKLAVDKRISPEDITIDTARFEEIPDYIRLATVAMFFIKPVLSKRSSCPTKFAEYLACGLPVLINSGIGDTDLIVEKNRLGAVVKRFNKEAYIKALNTLLVLLKERDSLSKRCQNVVNKEFSLELGVSRYFDAYNRVMTKL